MLLLAVLAAPCWPSPAPAADDSPGLHYYYPVKRADPPRVIETEVCVYGATPGGVTAAVQARRMGKKAVLLEFGRHLGGMTAGGLSQTDGGEKSITGGIADEFYTRVGRRGLSPIPGRGDLPRPARQG